MKPKYTVRPLRVHYLDKSKHVSLYIENEKSSSVKKNDLLLIYFVNLNLLKVRGYICIILGKLS